MDKYLFEMENGEKEYHEAIDIFEYYSLLDDLKFFKRLYKWDKLECLWQEVTS